MNLPSGIADNWPTYRHDNQNTSSSLELGPTKNQLEWSIELEGYCWEQAPLIFDDNLFISGENFLFCYYLKNQTLKWKIPKVNSDTKRALGIDDECVFYADGSNVYCLDRLNGARIWKYTASSRVPTPITITADKIFFSSSDGVAYALEKDTGTLLWNYETEYQWVITKPPVKDDKVIFTFSNSEENFDGRVYCFEVNSGIKIWEYGVKDSIKSSPTISSNKVFFGDDDGYFNCLNLHSGERIWRREFDMITSSPAVSGNDIYFGCWDYKIYCLDKNSGGTIWSYETNDWVMSSPAVSDNLLYIGSSDQYLYAFDKINGDLVWKYRTGNSIETPITIANNSIYVLSGHRIYCFNKYHNIENQDLFLSKTDLTYDPYYVEKETEKVKLTARIHNMGKFSGSEGGKFTVYFYDGEVHENNVIDKQTITISDDGLNKISTNLYVNAYEPKKITVKITETDFIEQNLSNNEANITVSVALEDESSSSAYFYLFAASAFCAIFLIIIIILFISTKMKKPICPKCKKAFLYPIHFQTWHCKKCNKYYQPGIQTIKKKNREIQIKGFKEIPKPKDMTPKSINSCPTCSNALSFNYWYGRWYCYHCGRYV